jgi:hypothetical protein
LVASDPCRAAQGNATAARSLDLSPSAVSKPITRLEGRLGARLLVCTTRALTPTDDGEAHHHAALRILRDLNDADRAAAGRAVSASPGSGCSTSRPRLRMPLSEDCNPGDLDLVHAIHGAGGPVPHRVDAFIDHRVETSRGSALPNVATTSRRSDL